MKQFLVIGGTGYLGRAIVTEIIQRGDQPIVFSNTASPELQALDVPIILGDIRNMEQLRRAFESLLPGAQVIHCAGLITIESKPMPGLSAVNITGTRNILQLCREYPVGRLCYVSSVHALPQIQQGHVKREIRRFSPRRVIGQYAKTKAMASQLVHNEAADGLNAVVVYPTGIVGPGKQGQGQTTPLIQAFLDGKLPFYVEGGHDFVDVRDVAFGVLAALERGRRGEAYILSGGYYTMKEILDMVAQVAGRKRLYFSLPAGLFRMVAPIVEVTSRLGGKKPMLTRYMAHVLASFELYSHQKAAYELGFRPRPMLDSVADTVVSLIEGDDEI